MERKEELNDFFEYFKKKEEEIINYDDLKMIIQDRVEFNSDYPLKELKKMSIEDYVIGANSKTSLCYNLEFGKYSKTAHGIGGGSAYKYGVFFSKGNYVTKEGIVEDVDSFWKEFKDQLYSYLIELEKGTGSIDVSKYLLLKGMPMVINKLACLYFPDKFINIGKKESIISLLKKFGYEYDQSLPTEQLSFLLNKKLREDLPELSQQEPFLIGIVLWDYLLMLNYSEEEKVICEKKYWLFSPGENAKFWDEFYKEGIIAIGWDKLGNLSDYSSKAEIKESLITNYVETKELSSNRNTILANYEFANEMNIGDIIYAKKGRTYIVGRGIVESEYYFDENANEYKSRRKVNWVNNEKIDHKATLGLLPTKSLTDITKYKDYVVKLEKLYNKDSDLSIRYNKEDFLEEVFMDSEFYDKIINTLERKRNIILQGTPGVGKTYRAKKLFYSMIEVKDESKVVTVQFHQSYSYEDFVQGFRPNESGNFELKNGIFYDLVTDAKKEYERAITNNEEPSKYCIIIDEINRGNLSKILGELMMLIEGDKRSKEWGVNLTYSEDLFYIPKNLYIIGTMNTADRSLATIDYALRRRFAFFTLEPVFDHESFKKYLIEENNLSSSFVDKLSEKFINLNKYISETLSKNFVIGHSYFIDSLDAEDIEAYNDIVEYEIKPLLEEYYFDETEKIETALDIIRI